MALIVNPKTKQQEKVVKAFLNSLAIDFQTQAEEEAIPYKISRKKSHTPKEKEILTNLDESVDFVNNYRKGKTKAKSLNQLLNEL